MRTLILVLGLLHIPAEALANCQFTLRLTNEQGDDWAGAMVRVTIGWGGPAPQVLDYSVTGGGMEEHQFTGSIGDLVMLDYLPCSGSVVGHTVELLALNG